MEIFQLFLLISLSNVAHLVPQTCHDVRKVFVAKHGIISNGQLPYGDSQRCEYLIKGDPGEYITINFVMLDMECAFDHLFVHDGPSRQSKLLATLTGKQHGKVLVSTTHMVYLILHTDDAKSGKGFNLTYNIYQCPNNCSNNGRCVNHTCECVNHRYGRTCEYMSCPRSCNNEDGASNSTCDLTSKKCNCGSGLYGESCTLLGQPNTNLNSWHNITTSSNFTARAGHVAGYIESLDVILVHGGYSYDGILDDVWFFSFSLNMWHVVHIIGPKPSARYDHAGIVHEGSFIIFGGELENGSYSNELWLFNVSTLQWKLLDSSPHILGVKLHSMNAVEGNLYVFGGQNSKSLVSSHLNVFDLSVNLWFSPQYSYGKDVDLRVFGHSTIYYEELRSFIVYGGFQAQVSSHITDSTNRLLLYHIDDHAWSVISEFPSGIVPPRTAYHTSVLAGNYMVVYGGMMIDAETDETCLPSTTIYYFNLKCGMWLDEKSLLHLYGNEKSDKGDHSILYSHAAVVRNKQTVFFIGGYNHAYVLNDVVAYKLPKTVVYLDTSVGMELFGTHCHLYSSDACLRDPSCMYCSGHRSPHGCFPLGSRRSNCKNSCSGLCSHLRTCESCTMQETACSWCTLDRKCYSSRKVHKHCNLRLSGWWESSTGRIIVNSDECQVDDNLTGLKLLKFIHPYKDQYPDSVSILLKSSDIFVPYNRKISNKKEKIIVLGIIHPYFRFKDALETNHKIILRGYGITANLHISDSNFNLSQSLVAHLENGSFGVNREDVAHRHGKRLFPVSGVEHRNTQKLRYVMKLTGEVRFSSALFSILWNHTDYDILLSDINLGYIQLYQSGNCSSYKSCMSCITDSICGWCELKKECISTSNWIECRIENGEPVYLSREESQCVTCSDHFDCFTCIQHSFCVWEHYAKCKRFGLQNNIIAKTVDECNPSCSSYDNMDNCLHYGKLCVWCLKKGTCISYYEYYLHNQFGQCYTFYEGQIGMPKPCSKYSSCKHCLAEYLCGWYYNATDPRIGKCLEGDFLQPISNVSGLPYPERSFEWEYSMCPDIDECLLGMHDCKNNSRCINQNGSYECRCNIGYEGDGRLLCKRACWPKCIQGVCTTDIRCECHLGWSGEDCSVNCGCHNHSTCVNGTGKCDKCQDYTTGEHCEYCMNGSYGNAVTSFCKKCECNGHGDPKRNFCDMKDGACFCINNTRGKHCEHCLPGFSSRTPYSGNFVGGASSVGHICHLSCNRSSIHFVNTSGLLMASYDGNNSPYISCLWILSATNLSHDSYIYNEGNLSNSILLKLLHLNISCSKSRLNIYDGVPPNPRKEAYLFTENFKLLQSVCSLDINNRVYRSETGILSLVYEGRTDRDEDDMYNYVSLLNEFMAEYYVLSCPQNCPAPFWCSSDMRCICADGFYGHMCNKTKCKNNCSESSSRGKCNKITFKCECFAGFAGEDCSELIPPTLFSLEKLNARYSYLSVKEVERLGCSLVHHNASLFVVGGTHFHDFDQPFTVEYHILSNEWRKVWYRGAEPAPRYAHCAFVYKGSMYIYGGISVQQVLKDIWRYSFGEKKWYNLQEVFPHLQQLAGHSCTMVNDTVYIFGGYTPNDGLNEFPSTVNLTTSEHKAIMIEDRKLKPPGLYSHVAIYDQVSEKIYIHGGMSFYHEKVQPSHLVYVFNLKYSIWDYVERLPGENAPSLVGHTGELIGDTLYIFGGYTDQNAFNQGIYTWKIRCNKWSLLKKGKDFQGNGNTDYMFLSSVDVNGSIYIFGGFHGLVSSAIHLFTIPIDPCHRHTVEIQCLQDSCNWCHASPACYGNIIPPYCTHNTSAGINGSLCTEELLRTRACSTFTSCISCLSSHPEMRTECHWCRCYDQRSCRDRNDPCPCSKTMEDIKSCHEINCASSTCRNCVGNCMWTKHLRYYDEVTRVVNQHGLETFNCFYRKLIFHLPDGATVYGDSSCPDSCNSFKKCTSCLHYKAHGVHGGTNYCYWSEKLSECLSSPILPIRCSFGRCGQLHVPIMNDACPLPCSTKKTCLSCIQNVGCGWSEQNSTRTGVCMQGDLTGPFKINHTFLYTWAYASCPLKNECFEGTDSCDNISEICEDLEIGYHCLCQEGYKRSLHSRLCQPICIGCVNGICVKPNVCACSFGWVGKNCSVKCLCNGHSNCINETSIDICIQCYNNTQGKYCDKCKPLYVGNPINGGKCESCKSVCHGNTDICISQAENKSLTDNKDPMVNIICRNCTNHSHGDKCETCIDGYYLKYRKCLKCRCNGHGTICNKFTGKECRCSDNTITPSSCERTNSESCEDIQCSKCANGYEGHPQNGFQCYKKIEVSKIEAISFEKVNALYYTPAPMYSNVDLRLIVDIYGGELDVFVTNADNKFLMSVDERLSLRQDRDDMRFIYDMRHAFDVPFIFKHNCSVAALTAFVKYNSSVLYVKGVKKRVVVPIHHYQHDLTAAEFFILLSVVNKASGSQGIIYFLQNQKRFDLTAFFLTLVVGLMLILSGFMLVCKVRGEFAQQRLGEEHMMERQSWARRPFTTYKIRCERNEDIDIIRKRKGGDELRKRKYSNGTPKKIVDMNVTPLAIQDTKDCLASVITVMIQYPENEYSCWNLSLGTGIFQSNHQQLIHIKTSHGYRGRKVETRFFNTQT